MKVTLTAQEFLALCARAERREITVYTFGCKLNPLRYEVDYFDPAVGQQELPVQPAKVVKREPIAPPGVHGRAALQTHLQKGN